MTVRAGSTSLERALTILELVARKSGGLTNAEVSRRLKMATSTSSYILSRLERQGYLRRDPESGRYEVGLKVVALAQGALRELGLRQISKPVLHKLVAETRLAGIVGVLESGRVMPVERVESPEFVKVDVAVGSRLPVHSTALGKVLIAHVSAEEFSTIIAEHGLGKRTPKTIVSRAQLMDELEVVRQQGYSVCDEESLLGVRAVAAPIFSGDGTVLAALSATGITTQPVWSRPREIIEKVKAAAREVSRQLY